MAGLAVVSEARLNRFAARHHLEPPLDRPGLTSYLTVTRRARIAGVAGALLATLVRTWSDQRIQADVTVLLCGWLVGALIAESRLNARAAGDGPRGRPDIARWIRWMPVALAAPTIGVAVFLHLAGPAELAVGSMDRWTVAGLAACVLVAATVAVIGRRAWPPIGSDGAAARTDSNAAETEAARATRDHSIGAVTAAGCLTVASVLIHQLGFLRSALFGPAAGATGTIQSILLVGGAVVAWIVNRSGWTPDPTEPAPIVVPRRPLAAVLTVVAILLVGVAAVGGYGWWRNRAPYGPSAVAASATIRLTDTGHFAADEAALGVTGLNPLLGDEHVQLFLGRVDYRVPAAAIGAGSYYVVVIDRRTNRIAANLYAREGSGWDGFLGEVPRKYPWLSAMAPMPSGGGFTSSGMAVSAPSDQPAPITFVGMITDGAGMNPSDLLVALIFIGDGEQIYWAVPLT